MKIRDIIVERKNATKVGNKTATIARTAKQAEKKFDTSDPGARDLGDPLSNLKRVRDMYGVELVDDFIDVLELPNNVDETDKETSLLTSDNRKK